MKKIKKHFLADISLELSPLSVDNEGQLRGGFAGLGGSEIEINVDTECTNAPCTNNGCTNHGCSENSQTNGCSNEGCSNVGCTHEGCSFGGTTGTTGTTKSSDPGSIGLLI